MIWHKSILPDPLLSRRSPMSNPRSPGPPPSFLTPAAPPAAARPPVAIAQAAPPMSVYGAPAPAAFAAPAMRVAPPVLSWRRWTAVAAIGLMVLAALSGVWLAARPSSPWRGRLLFAGQMALLTAALCL